MRFNDRPKVKVDIASDGQITYPVDSEIPGYSDVSWSAEYGEAYPYLLTQGSNYEFGYLEWTFDPGEPPGSQFTNYRNVYHTNVGEGAGFPASTTGLTFSYVAGKHNFVSSTSNGSDYAPETGGSGAMAVGPSATALVDESAAVGRGAQALGVGSMAVGNQAKAVRPYELAYGPPAPVREAVFGVYASTGTNEEDYLKQTSSPWDSGGSVIDFGSDPLGEGKFGVTHVTLDLYLTPQNSTPASLSDVRIVQLAFTIGYFASGTSVMSSITTTTKHAGANVPAPTYTLTSGGTAVIQFRVSGVADVTVRGVAKVQRLQTVE